MTDRTACLVVLLRAVNLGSHNKLPMPRLRELLTDLGARDVVTYLQSGQAVVGLAARQVPTFAERVHRAIEADLGLDIAVFTRTRDELAAVVADNPYPHLVETPKRLHVAFLAADPDPEVVQQVGRRHGDDEFTVGDRTLYLAYSANSRDSPLVGALRRLSVVTTARNWTTVTTLADLAARR